MISVYWGKIFFQMFFPEKFLLIFSKSLPGSEMMMLYECVCVGEMFCRKWDRAVSALYHRKLDGHQPVNKQAQGNGRKLSVWETKAEQTTQEFTDLRASSVFINNTESVQTHLIVVIDWLSHKHPSSNWWMSLKIL